MLDALRYMDGVTPFSEITRDPATNQPQYVDRPVENRFPLSMQESFNLYRIDHSPNSSISGYLSPYMYNNWDMTSGMMKFIDDSSRIPSIDNRIDPNKVFSSDVAALRALAADQNKITKMFEKRLIESLADKGKFGLTEDDVNAMQALTSARSAILSIQNAQITIKKNAAELRIKQQQQQGRIDGSTGNSMDQSMNGNDFGRSMLDTIFNMDIPANTVEYSADDIGLDHASEVLDSLVPEVSEPIAYESSKPETVVVMGDSDDDYEYVTYDSSGNEIADYPKPTSTIKTVDRDNKVAIASNEVRYPIRFKD
jgi:hypothetical protein